MRALGLGMAVLGAHVGFKTLENEITHRDVPAKQPHNLYFIYLNEYGNCTNTADALRSFQPVLLEIDTETGRGFFHIRGTNAVGNATGLFMKGNFIPNGTFSIDIPSCHDLQGRWLSVEPTTSREVPAKRAIASHLSDLGIESYEMLESIKGLAERMGVEAGSESSDDTPEKTTEMMDAIFAQLSLM